MSSSVGDATEANNTQGTNDRWPDVAVILVIAVFSLLLCSPILSGRVPAATDTLALWPPWSQLAHEPISNSTTADSVLLYLSWNQFEREAIADGEWPMWDPYSFAGSSFAANSQSQLYYPSTWLLWLLPLSGGIQLLTLFNIWVAGVGMYLLCRHWRLSRIAALVASLSFAGSGMLQLAVELPGVASPYGWLPWILLALDKSMQEKSSRWVALAALYCGLELVSGNLQWAIYCYFAAASWTAWRFGRAVVSGGIRRAARVLVPPAIALAGGLTLACVHLIPLFELMGLSNRGSTRVSSNSASLTTLLRLLMPEYFGSSVDNVGAPLVFNDLWYVGIVVLLVGVIGLALPGRIERWFWLGMAIFAVLVTYGVGPFLYVRWLPGMSSLLPARIGYLFIFSVALLAGYGLDAWVSAYRQIPRRAMVTLAVTIVLMAGLMLQVSLAQGAGTVPSSLAALRAEQIGRAWLLIGASSLLLTLYIGGSRLLFQRIDRRGVENFTGVAIIVLLIADLLTVAPDYSSYVAPDKLMPEAPSVTWLKSNADLERTISLGVREQPPTLVPNVQMLYGFQSVSGYDSLHTARYEEFWGAVDPSVRPSGPSTPYANVFVRPQAYSSTLASLLNIRYITAASPLNEPVGVRQVYSSEMVIYEKGSTGPRAFFVTSAEVLPRGEVLARLTANDFATSTDLVLDSGESPPANSVGSSAPTKGSGQVQIAEYRRNSVTLDIDALSEGWLVLADQNYPGWTATVDGSPQKVYSADYLLRAVPVTAGRHQVVFRYLPTNFVAAVAISSISLALILLACVGGWIRDKAKRRRFVVNSGVQTPQEASNDDGW
jgi:hypothetical protein